MSSDLEKQATNESSFYEDASQSTEVNSDSDSEVQQESSSDPSNAPTFAPVGVTSVGPIKKTVFGLKKAELAYDPIAATHDYTVKYKSDPVFHELDDNARVWFVYNDEVNAFDSDMIEEASDSLDILLVFAGLFSAVLTTLIVQTVQSLSPDSAAISASLLQELVQLQRAQGNQTLASSVPPANIAHEPSSIDKWVNGLWFTSLALSLSSALLAVLAKQWLRSYLSLSSGAPRDRALMRQFRFNGFDRWNVRPIIGFLPTILHISLILFLIGLVIFLTPLDIVIAVIIGAITFILLSIYTITSLLPIKFVQCPYRTPLTDFLYRLLRLCFKESFKHRHIREAQRSAVSARSDPHSGTLEAEYEALDWLLETTTNPSAERVVYQCIGALQPPRVQLIGTKRLVTLESVNQAQIPDEGGKWVHWLSYILEKGFEETLPVIHHEDTRSLGQDEKDDMQRGLTAMVHLFVQDAEPPSLAYGGDNMRFAHSDLGLALVALACSDPNENTKVIIDDEDSERPPFELRTTDAFPWIIDNYESLTIPELPPVVWMRLQANANWTLRGIQNPKGASESFQHCIRESLRSRGNWPVRGPISLELFLKYQISALELGQKLAFWDLADKPESNSTVR